MGEDLRGVAWWRRLCYEAEVGTVQFCLVINLPVCSFPFPTPTTTCSQNHRSSNVQRPRGMGKRPKVPVALQSEISGYLGLLRALRATSTLDLTSHLIQSSQSPSLNDQNDQPFLDSVHYPRDSSELGFDYISQATLAEAIPKSPEATLKTVTGHGTPSSRDTWTRWPVLAADVPIPEWDLEDEDRVLAVRTLKQSRPRDMETTVDSIDDQELGNISGDEEQEDSLLTPTVVNALTEATSKYLAEILASMAEIHRPAPSLSNRIRPYDWQSVLNVASNNGLIDNMCVC